MSLGSRCRRPNFVASHLNGLKNPSQKFENAGPNRIEHLLGYWYDAGSKIKRQGMKISVVGNCQTGGLVACIQLMVPDAEVVGIWGHDTAPSPLLKNSDLVFMQSEFEYHLDNADYWDGVPRSAIKLIPAFVYTGFHPDLTHGYIGDARLKSPLDDYNSALVLYGWLKGLSSAETVRLFCDPVNRRLNYYEYGESSRQHLIALGDRCEIDLRPLLKEWSTRGCFAHSINHPKLFVLSSLARTVLSRYGLKIAVNRPEDYLHDELVNSAIWPVYPEIAVQLNIIGNYEFKVPNGLRQSNNPVEVLDLEQFVERSFACYAQHPKESLNVPRLIDQRELYRDLESLIAKPRRKRENPYSNLPDYCFWQRGVTNIAAADLDPVVTPKFRLAHSDRIATAGSCFAQHIAKTLIAADYNYFVAEPAPASMLAEAAASRGYGLFSARFGNVYSARQLLQLFQRAYGEFSPDDIAWRRDDERFVDPFRPQIEPDGFISADAVFAAREEHFAAVRRMFEQSALFVFTVGLTEAWAANSDGAVFPVAPGVVSGSLNRDDYHFINFKVADIIADLNAFIDKLRSVNRDIRLLFTVSPVPLVATYENRHVLVSTTYSKSAIRAAVEEVTQQYDFVDYFPSYEIITGWYNNGKYFDRDLRSVTPEGVGHVMRLFSKHYLQSAVPSAAAADHHMTALRQEIAQVAKIVCDEELLNGSGNVSGLVAPGAPAVQAPRGESIASANAARSGYGEIAAPAWLSAASPVERDTQITKFVRQIEELQTQLSGLRDALSHETTAREDQTRHLAEQSMAQAEQIAILRVSADDAAGRIETLQAENDSLRERLDQLTHGVTSWLMPTLEKHAVMIDRRRHPIRQLGRRARRIAKLF